MAEEEVAVTRPVVVCGPSGVGKGTLLRRLLARYPDKFQLSVSHTTRDPRPGEKHGKEYYFTSIAQMRHEIEQGRFIEYAEVHGQYYGTSCRAVEDIGRTGKCCILELDIQGAVQLRRLKQFDPFYIFVNAPSIDDLRQRLKGRGTDSQESIVRRLDTAEKELAGLKREQNSPTPLFHTVLVNDDLERTYANFEELMLQWAGGADTRSDADADSDSKADSDADVDSELGDAGAGAQGGAGNSPTYSSEGHRSPEDTDLADLEAGTGWTRLREQKDAARRRKRALNVVAAGSIVALLAFGAVLFAKRRQRLNQGGSGSGGESGSGSGSGSGD